MCGGSFVSVIFRIARSTTRALTALDALDVPLLDRKHRPRNSLAGRNMSACGGGRLIGSGRSGTACQRSRVSADGSRTLAAPKVYGIGGSAARQTTAAVVIAQTFVSAPFYIRAAKSGFAGIDVRLEQISATLGESPLGTFRRITLPLARSALIGGAIMTWARSLGEFGATILFAGNFVGRTQTMPLAIYSALQSDLNVALALAAILLVTSAVLLVLLRLVTR